MARRRASERGQKVFLLNDYRDVEMKRRYRYSSFEHKTNIGKSRYTLNIKAEPLLVGLEEVALVAGPAAAALEAIREDIGNITENAAKGTLEFRKEAHDAYFRGDQWALDRYRQLDRVQGPVYPPGSSNKLFNDSGRLRQGISLKQNPREGAFTVNLPASRDLNGGDPKMFQKFVRLVPSVSPRKLIGDARFEKAVAQTVVDAIRKAANQNEISRLRLRYQRWQAIRQAMGLARTVARLGA